ncbi:MAG: chemotaxis protein CheW [Piscirickettsiaceae bacterium]|jgi:chemosensory pili system protein ChpC|nr:chemotaxis protein CheW [Piscirickettsiaceae bacterium]
MAELSTDFIPCMLLPLQQHYLLLPNTTIAEVIPMPRITLADDKPSYYRGQYQWASHKITILDLENLVENEEGHSDEANKLCIIYSINSDTKLQAYALPCHGAPQLIHLNETALKLVDDDEKTSEFLHCRTHIGNKIAYIPNLDKLEELVLEHR